MNSGEFAATAELGQVPGLVLAPAWAESRALESAVA